MVCNYIVVTVTSSVYIVVPREKGYKHLAVPRTVSVKQLSSQKMIVKPLLKDFDIDSNLERQSFVQFVHSKYLSRRRTFKPKIVKNPFNIILNLYITFLTVSEKE